MKPTPLKLKLHIYQTIIELDYKKNGYLRPLWIQLNSFICIFDCLQVFPCMCQGCGTVAVQNMIIFVQVNRCCIMFNCFLILLLIQCLISLNFESFCLKIFRANGANVKFSHCKFIFWLVHCEVVLFFIEIVLKHA